MIGKQRCDNVVLDIQRCSYHSSEDLLLIINIQIMCKYVKCCFVIVYKLFSCHLGACASIIKWHTDKDNEKEIRQFIGMSIVMANLKFPRVNMYWAEPT